MPKKRRAQSLALFGLEFASDQNQTPALVPHGIGIGINMARGLGDAVLAGRAEKVVRPTAAHLRLQPVFLD